MFYFERKKNLCSIFTVFVGGYLSTAVPIFWKATNYCHKILSLRCRRVLNPPQYALTKMAYRNTLIQVADER